MRRRQRRFVAVAVVAMLCASLAPARAASAAPPAECSTAGPEGPMWVTADCIDPLYNETNAVLEDPVPVSTPEPHVKVSGSFTGTDYKFNIYLPPASSWDGRFYQHVYPFMWSENASDSEIGFAFASGGYLVRTSSAPCSCAGYRVDAAVAKLARKSPPTTTGSRPGSTATSGAAAGGRSRRSRPWRTRPGCGTAGSRTSSPTRPRSRTTTRSSPSLCLRWKTSCRRSPTPSPRAAAAIPLPVSTTRRRRSLKRRRGWASRWRPGRAPNPWPSTGSSCSWCRAT